MKRKLFAWCTGLLLALVMGCSEDGSGKENTNPGGAVGVTKPGPGGVVQLPPPPRLPPPPKDWNKR